MKGGPKRRFTGLTWRLILSPPLECRFVLVSFGAKEFRDRIEQIESSLILVMKNTFSKLNFLETFLVEPSSHLATFPFPLPQANRLPCQQHKSIQSLNVLETLKMEAMRFFSHVSKPFHLNFVLNSRIWFKMNCVRKKVLSDF
jgi:hypothetical protein